MAIDPQPTDPIGPELLPEHYDALVSVEQLIHGDHNPRRVRPKDALRESIATNGINRPLIVRPDEKRECYHITDGWQRYQAATACGWESLPVRIYETPLEALRATETESIVREWSTYEWAQYCRSLAQELETDSNSDLAQEVAARTTRSPQTVKRYLDVLSLPSEIHPLLTDGPTGTHQDWTALQHYNEEVRRYNGLSWMVAARITRTQTESSRSRIVELAAKAVEFDTVDDSLEFVEAAADQPETPLETVRKQVLFGSHHNRYLEVPRVAVQVTEEEKRAIMEYCHRTRQSLSEIVAVEIEALANEAATG